MKTLDEWVARCKEYTHLDTTFLDEAQDLQPTDELLAEWMDDHASDYEPTDFMLWILGIYLVIKAQRERAEEAEAKVSELLLEPDL